MRDFLFTDKEMEHLVFAGAYADLSIDSPARHASELGYHTTVLSDCCGATSIGAGEAILSVTLPRLVHPLMISEEGFKEVEKSNSQQVSSI